MKRRHYTYIYGYGRILGYDTEYGFIEKHYSNPENLASKQFIDYRVRRLEEDEKTFIFRTLIEARKALEEAYGTKE